MFVPLHSTTIAIPTQNVHQRRTAVHQHFLLRMDTVLKMLSSSTYNMLHGYAMDCTSDLCSLSDTPNFKDFVWSYYIPTYHSMESIGMWYRRFTAHGATNGIYIQLYKSVIADHSLGAWFDHMPKPIRCNIRIMSQYKYCTQSNGCLCTKQSGTVDCSEQSERISPALQPYLQ
jgi:hypothetical protein